MLLRFGRARTFDESCRHWRLLVSQIVVLMVDPPSITMVCPVMNAPAGEASITAAPAISSTSPIRRNGARAVARPRISGFSQRWRAKSVRTRPGAMLLARTLWGPYYTAMFRAICMSAALEIE